MSMIGNFRLSTDEEVRELLAEPERIEALLYADDGGGDDDSDLLDVDKAWHGIHYLLCGDAWAGNPPMNFIVGGGTSVGEVDVGYGAARAFTSAEVAAIAGALEPISPADLRSRYNAAEFTEQAIYPEIWDEPESDCLDDYVLAYFGELKEFVLAARDQGRAMLVYIN